MLHKFVSLGTSASLLRTSLGNYRAHAFWTSSEALHTFRWNLVPYVKMLLSVERELNT